MSPTIYTSSHPKVFIPQTSVFTHVFASRGQGDIGGFPGSMKAFIDSASGAYITRAQLMDLALSFAHGLRNHPNTRAKRGDTVLIHSPNSLAVPVVLFGCVAAGIRCSTANSAYNFQELAHQYTDSRAKIVITAEDGLKTTTHLNIISLLSMVGAHFPPIMQGDMMIGILPFYHIYGEYQVVNLPLVVGLPVVIQPRFEPTEFCANIEKYKVTHGLIVPPILVVLARHPAAEKYNLSTLRYLCSGAAPLGRDLVLQVKQRLRKNGAVCDIAQGYGLTETSPTTHLLPHFEADRKMGTIGLLMPNLEARLVDDDDGDVDAEEGKPGELWIRGPSVMKGYLNNPAATANAITRDGWFRTGDVAIRDKEGFFTIVDRRKELIKYKCPPAELESVLLTHADIADSAVIGVDDIEQATELPRAYVVHAHPEEIKTSAAKALFAESVVKWMETKVAKHKFLRGGVSVIEAIPKSAAGKILRRELRDLAKTERAVTPLKSKL
ncbi:4-coumarate--CoA ligase-like 7 [Mycena venus]|uniref:4-coumarate--CoA ligase-like 7 n=1 Tax=Mycena venus TaxID=2733690 RepID=A0A8H6YLJ7_9AGAR|nr:4-coumarate--CoA ligase-like 7 [Mycena venus]